MMLSLEEVKETIDSVSSTTPDAFEKYVADYMPQGVLQRLMDDMIHIYASDHTLAEAAEKAAVFMVGLQMGWVLSEKAHFRP